MRAGRPVILLAVCFGALGWGLEAALDHFFLDEQSGRFWGGLVGGAPAGALCRLAGFVVLFVGFALLVMRLQRGRGGRE